MWEGPGWWEGPEWWEGSGWWEGPSLCLLVAPCDAAPAGKSTFGFRLLPPLPPPLPLLPLSLPPPPPLPSTTILVMALAPSLPSVHGMHMLPGMRECVSWADDHAGSQASCGNPGQPQAMVLLPTRGQYCSHGPPSASTFCELFPPPDPPSCWPRPLCPRPAWRRTDSQRTEGEEATACSQTGLFGCD